MLLHPVIIETNRLVLKGFTPQDMTHLFTNYSPTEVSELLGHQNEAEYLTEKSKVDNGYATYNRTFLVFLLVEKTSHTVIGRCGLHNWNTDHHRAEIGYHMVLENYKRQGFMSEAVAAIIDHGFKELKLHRIEALVGRTNTASLRIIEKQGFVKEGLLRQHYFINGVYEDSVMFSKLAVEHFK